MKARRLAISDVIILEPAVFTDNRGYFFESYNEQKFSEIVGRKVVFVQDNHSLSKRNVLRGLHYQVPPRAQAKIVRVVKGAIFDVAVDLRKTSPTFGQWVGEILSSENRHQMWIPEGFAHGFLSLSDETEILYKTTDFYDSKCERCISWNDESVAIDWPLMAGQPPHLSEKDKMGKKLNQAETF